MILPKVCIYSKLTVGTTVYEEDDLHKPYFTRTASRQGDFKSFAKDADRLYTFTNVQPRKGKEFREMELDIAWDEFAGCKLFSTPKLIVIKFPSLNTAGAYTFLYGWIDDAEPVATKGPQPNTRIKWHVDWWLTWTDYNWFMLSGQPQILANWSPRRVTIGAGRLTRGPAKLARPDPSLPRQWVYSGKFIELNNPKGPAVIVIFNKTGASGETSINIASWWLNDKASDSNPIPIEMIYSGLTEECMGLDPDSIIGIYFAPFMPIEPNSPHGHKYQDVMYDWYEQPSGKANTLQGIGWEESEETDDAVKWVVIDPLGTTYATLPWHMKFKYIDMRIDVGTSGASLIVTFEEQFNQPHQRLTEGRRIQIPLISAPVTSNAMASYVLSGKQEYDRTMAAIQQEQNFKSGIANAGTGAIGGAIAGSAASPGLGTLAGLIGGAASSVLGSYFTGEIQKETDKKSFEAMDRYTSNQTSNVIISAGGTAWLLDGEAKWMLVKLKRDPESLEELETEQSELGYVTDSYKTDCSPIIAAGGGLRIEGLEIKGDIPREGKNYISSLFARGVHIDLIK